MGLDYAQQFRRVFLVPGQTQRNETTIGVLAGIGDETHNGGCPLNRLPSSPALRFQGVQRDTDPVRQLTFGEILEQHVEVQPDILAKGFAQQAHHPFR